MSIAKLLGARLTRRRVIALGTASIALALTTCTVVRAPEATAAEPVRPKHVFIISFDGGKPSVMKESKMPTLFQMVKEGAVNWNAQTIFPSITLVSHTSMLSGVTPAKHGIMWNDWKPEKGVITVPTVFSVAKTKKLTTMLIAGKEKFHHLNIPGSLDTMSVPTYKAQKVAAVAARYIETVKPNVCFIHFADSDGAGHKYGWGSPEQIKSFEDEDDALNTVMEGIKAAGIANESVVILTADHGGHGKTHGSNDPEDMTIPWIVWGAGVKPGATISVPVTTYDTAATALWLLDVPAPATWDGKPVMSAFAGN